MRPELQQVFDSASEDEPRSRLEPYRELILRWRRQGRTYRWIGRTLRDKCGLTVAYGPLYRFVQRRARPCKPQPPQELECKQAAMATEMVTTEHVALAVTHAKLSPEEAEQKRALLQSLRNKPAPAPKPAVLLEFCYDEDKPLTIDRTIKD